MEKSIIMPNFNITTECIGHEDFIKEHWLKCWHNPKEDITDVFLYLDNTLHLAFVIYNFQGLMKMGKFEELLLSAYGSTRTNFSNYSMADIQAMFNFADKEKLRALGDPIPEQEYFTLYRGVSGKGRARRVNGFSWTESPNIAAWFAMRLNLKDPAVFTVTVPRESILARIIDRKESEYLLKLPLPMKPKRLKTIPERKKDI